MTVTGPRGSSWASSSWRCARSRWQRCTSWPAPAPQNLGDQAPGTPAAGW